MEFPVHFDVFGLRIHVHPVFELLAYVSGFLVYLRLRRREGDVLSDRRRWLVIFAAGLGAMVGSKVLFWLMDPADTWSHRADFAWLMSGKTIVGGMLGAVAAVEFTKWKAGIETRTGDLFALPVALGVAVGRIGCFLTGLEDKTHGGATSLPWGVDFGDGIARHPTQLYEIVFMLLLALWIVLRARKPYLEGDLFRGAFVFYLAWRLAIDFLKPGVRHGPLTSIQWACVVGLLCYCWEVPRILGWRKVLIDEPA